MSEMRFNPLDHPICLTLPKRLAPSTWIQHVPFAMYLIDALRPRVFVELGTFYGVSYCAFCQAVKELQLETRCYAIDTWQGDPQGGFFGHEVLADLKEHHDPLYSQFSELIPSSFSEALNRFEPSSVDLLHIDGFHTYEAVKNDFDTWLPKMSERGVVLFHDIAVHENDFGVWQLWQDLKTKYPSYEVSFGYGLGVIATGDKYPQSLSALFEASGAELDQIREYFYQLGLRVELAQEFNAYKRSIAEAELAAVARTKQLKTDHPYLTRASNLFQLWASEGLSSALRAVQSKLGGSHPQEPGPPSDTSAQPAPATSKL